MLHRRAFLSGAIAALATPAIVRAENIMPVKLVRWVKEESYRGVRVWESYPWLVEVDYDQHSPVGIKFPSLYEPGSLEQDGVRVRSLYVPPDFPAEQVAALGPEFVQGTHVKDVRQANHIARPPYPFDRMPNNMWLEPKYALTADRKKIILD